LRHLAKKPTGAVLTTLEHALVIGTQTDKQPKNITPAANVAKLTEKIKNGLLRIAAQCQITHETLKH